MPTPPAAVGERLPAHPQSTSKPMSSFIAELVLHLTHPRMETVDGQLCARATATVIYEPGGSGDRPLKSTQFTFTAPLGPIERGELNWYLERYYLWPVGLFKDRAARIESNLPKWG